MGDQGLAGLRVVEVGGPVVAPAAGKLFADLGATVVKLEPPAGEPGRAQSGPDGAPSGNFRYLNSNKRSVLADLTTAKGRETLGALCARADLLIHDLPVPDMAAHGLDYAALSARNARLVMVSATPFGLSGPYRDYRGADLPLVHGGGLAWLSPDKCPAPQLPPLRPYGQHALMQGGLHAAIVGMGAVHGAARTGIGEHVDLSVFEVVAHQLCRHFGSYSYAQSVETRLGRNLAAPATYFPCKDGFIYLIAVEQDQWERLVAMMGQPAWALGEEFSSTSLRGRPETMELLEREIADWTKEWLVLDLFHALQARRIGSAPVYLPADLETDAHLQERGFFRDLEENGTTLRIPGAPYVLDRDWWQLRTPAPALGEAGSTDAPALFGETATGPPDVRAGADAPPPKPLEGIRVLDLSWVWAGPYATQMLAFLGAEVIKIESSRRPDLARRLNLYPPGMDPGLNRCGYFNQIGIGKQSVALNLGHPEGIALARQLAGQCDVVISNFATGVLERLGLGVSVLQAQRPDLIIANLSAYGQTGPYRNYTGYGPAIFPMAGLGALTGYEDSDLPGNLRPAYADPNAGAYMTFAVLAGLESRRKRGGGLVIDMSLWESMICTGFDGWMEHAAGGPGPKQMGNRDPHYAPHNVYRCMGEDEWVAIAVTSDAQWTALCDVLGRADLTADPALRTAAGRKARESELDAALAEWCAPQDKWQVTERLQAAGVPAFPSLRNKEIAEDRHLLARSFVQTLDHPEVGERCYTAVPWQMARRAQGPLRRAPLLGEHTDAVLESWLQLPPVEIARLRETGAIE